MCLFILLTVSFPLVLWNELLKDLKELIR